MWDSLWVDGAIATMQTGRGPYGAIANGAVAVAEGKVAWVGPMDDLPGRPEALARKVVDLQGRWLLPGLIDCHTHLVWGGSRADEFEQRLEGAGYAEIARRGGGIRSTVRATRAAAPDKLQTDAQRRLDDLMREGVTTVEIKSGYGLDIDTEMKQLRVARALGEANPVRVVTSFLGAHTLPPEFEGEPDTYIAFVCETVLPAVAEAGLADAVDAFGETIAFTPDQVARVFEAARHHGLPVKLHADQLSDQGGAAVAARYGALSADHLEYTSEAGVRALAEAGSVAVLLPGAFYYLRETTVPPVAALRAAGVPMAVATDCNPGSSPVSSLRVAMNMACVLFRLTPEEALAGATREAARALGLGEKGPGAKGAGAARGQIAPGFAADFSLWDVTGPAEIVYPLGDNRCVGRVLGGESCGAIGRDGARQEGRPQ
jgi:imidazolonepropionase